jgi:hypothetical protein
MGNQMTHKYLLTVNLYHEKLSLWMFLLTDKKASSIYNCVD